MAVSSKFNTKGQVKSISLPSRSHPTTLLIEQALNTAATALSVAPSADTICNGLLQLEEVYKCLDDLLNSSTTRALISRQQNKKWVDELVEESIKFLDVCGSIRDIVGQIKEHIIDVHCALRTRKGDLYVENSIMKYNSFRKKTKKDVKLILGSLKQVDHMITSCDDHQLAAVMKAIIGASEMTISVFESLLMFFSMTVSKTNKWSIVVSKLIHKGMVACEEQQGTNEFETIDAALQNLCKYESATQTKKMQIAKFRLEKMEQQIECMETRLECVFRRLIRNRASLLNIITL